MPEGVWRRLPAAKRYEPWIAQGPAASAAWLSCFSLPAGSPGGARENPYRYSLAKERSRQENDASIARTHARESGADGSGSDMDLLLHRRAVRPVVQAAQVRDLLYRARVSRRGASGYLPLYGAAAPDQLGPVSSSPFASTPQGRRVYERAVPVVILGYQIDQGSVCALGS